MSLQWKLGTFIDGTITRAAPLPVKNQAGEVSIDIHGEDTAEISIAKKHLTTTENNTWKTLLRPIVKMVVCDDTSKAWNAPHAIPMAGFINKTSDQIAPGIINAQVTGLNEYLKARIVADTDSAVSDPTASIEFTGATWSDIVVAIITRAFSTAGIADGKPKPPQVLGTLPTHTAGSLTKAVKITDAKTYFELLQEVCNDDAGNGLEWRWLPRWATADRSKVVWDLIVGTNAQPHIGEATQIELDLSENGAKFSAFNATINSNDMYSKLYIQSKAGDKDEKSGADFTPASVSDSTFPILVERFFNPGVELTPEQLQAQLQARLDFAAKEKFETSFTIEENADIAIWRERIGNTIKLNGIDGTLSAGQSATVRCVGISFVPGTDSIKADVMQLAPTYPKLPKSRAGELIPNDNRNSSPISFPPVSGGGVTPTPTPAPTPPPGNPYEGVDGIFTPDDLFGDLSRNPWDTWPPKTPPTIAFKPRKDSEQIVENYDGLYPIHPWSVCTGSGNRLYGLDRVSFTWENAYDSQGVLTTTQDGLLDINTGQPVGGWRDIYVKKTYMAEGTLGPVVTVGKIPAAVIKSAVPSWAPDTYGTNNIFYNTSIGVTNFVVNDKFYAVIGAKNIISWDGTTYAHYRIADATIFSNKIDKATGNLSDEWKNEGKWEEGLHSFPLTPFIAKSGSCLYFTRLMRHVKTKFQNGLWGGMSPSAYYDDQIQNHNVEVYEPNAAFGSLHRDRSSGGLPGVSPNGGVVKDFADVPMDLVNKYIKSPDATNNNPGNNATPRYKFSSKSGAGFVYGKHLYVKSDDTMKRIKIQPGGGHLRDENYQFVGPAAWVYNSDPMPVVNGHAFFNYVNGQQTVLTAKIDGETAPTVAEITDPAVANFLFTRDDNGTLKSAVSQYNTLLPLAEDAQTNPYEKPYEFASKIFVYDSNLYTFQLQKNGEKRNKLAIRSLEAFDPTA